MSVLRAGLSAVFLYNVVLGEANIMTKWSGYAFGGYIFIAGLIGLGAVLVILLSGGVFENVFNVLVYTIYCVGGVLVLSYARGSNH